MRAKQKSQLFRKLDFATTNLLKQNQIQSQTCESVTWDLKSELTLAVLVGIHWPYEP